MCGIGEGRFRDACIEAHYVSGRAENYDEQNLATLVNHVAVLEHA